MEGIKRYWITGLAVLLGVFLLFLAVAIAIDPDEQATSTAEQAFGVVVDGVLGLSLLGGLWLLRQGRGNQSVALGAVALGAVGGIIWFWMIFPPVIALVVIWFGVIRRGLVRELVAA
ncbi:MAG: hypothetical protein ACR2OI_06515 [Acidimicrobiia bacterium]